MKEFNSYDVVMKAIVLEIDGPEAVKKAAEYDYDHSYNYGSPPSEQTVFKLKVTKNIKGNAARNSKLVMMPSSKFDYYCSYHKLEVGKTYYFFTNKENGALTTTYTSRVIAPKAKLPAEKNLCSINKKLAGMSTKDQKYKNLEHNKPYIEKQVARQKETLKYNLAFLSNILTNSHDIWVNKSGKMEAKGQLVNGAPTGDWEYYDNNGTIREKGTHKKNKRHGLWISYSKKGDIYMKTIYKNGKKEGEEVTFYKGGEIQRVYQFTGGKKEGVQKFYYENGKLYTSVPYTDNEIHGISTTYSQSGQLISSKPYKNGVPNGQFVTFHESGKQSTKTTYKDGKIIGESISYHPSGIIKHKSQYNDKGKPVGEWIYYNKDGSISTKRTYDLEGNLVSN